MKTTEKPNPRTTIIVGHGPGLSFLGLHGFHRRLRSNGFDVPLMGLPVRLISGTHGMGGFSFQPSTPLSPEEFALQWLQAFYIRANHSDGVAASERIKFDTKPIWRWLQK